MESIAAAIPATRILGTDASPQTPTSPAMGAAGSLLSAHILRISWTSLIPSFGLTILYINLHFIGKYLAHSRWFAPFGSEWSMSKMAPGKSNLALEYGEIIAMIFLDVILILATLTLLVFIRFIVLAMTNYCAMAQQFGLTIATVFAVFAPGSLAGCFMQS